MKLILASTFLIVGASASKQSSLGAGLRGQHKVEGTSKEQRELQSVLFGGSSGGFSGVGSTDLLFQCTDACSDQAACSSFMMAFNPTSLFEDACNTGCFPQSKLLTCQQMCQQNVNEPWEEDEAPTSPAAVAVARLGFFDSAVEMMCNDCKFYECCSSTSTEEDVVTSPVKRSTKYETCMVHLPESLDDQAFGDSVLDQITASLGDAINAVAESFEESIPEYMNITQALDAATGGGNTNDLDLDSVVDQLVDTVSGAVDSITEALDLPQISVPSGTDQASGLSVLGQLVDSMECPSTCQDQPLCDAILMGGADRSTIGDACNTGCLPTVESCDEVCGNGDGTELLSTITDMACETCKFISCCGKEGQDAEAKFTTCQAYLPEMSEALIDTDWAFDPQATQEWFDNLDWNAILESFGLSDMFEGLQTMLNEAMADFNTMSESVSCDPSTCPIEGLCDMSVDMASLDVEDICKKDAFFQCGGGLQQMCLDKCSGDTDGFAPLCSLCDVATCCQEKEFGEDTTFEKCVSASVTEEDLVQDDSSPSEAAGDSSELNGGPAKGLQSSSSEASSGTPIEADSEVLPSEEALDESAGGSESELLSSANGPEDATLVVSRIQGSGSSVSATSKLYVALASIATLMFASL